MPWGDFKLSQLKLDQQNIRTGNQPDQRAALHALVADQNQKLVNLALDLIDVGPSPGEPIWVTADPDDAGQNIVLEGNRRVAAFKMLDNPRLAKGTDLEAEFAAMAKDFAKNPRRVLEAQIFASREDAWPWIERRHMSPASGVGLQGWRSLALERHRAGAGGSVRRSLLVLDFLDDGSDAFGEVGAIINAKATTVDRVLNAPAMIEALGVAISRKDRTIQFGNGDQIAGRRLLRDLITAMAQPDFSFSRIRDADDRDSFVRSFADRAVRAPSTGGPGAGSGGPAGGTAGGRGAGGGGQRPTETPRSTLAPRSGDRVFAKVSGTRLNRLYRECRDIRLAGNENAAALLLRVFIELSSEAYLIEKNMPLPAKPGKVPKTDWSEVGITLADKINTVMAAIDTSTRTKQQLKKARVALANTHANGSIDTLHSYFHNLDMNPDVAGIRDAWDTWENYLALLHAARS
jgi:hypothetical protein